MIKTFKSNGIRTSIFVDPDPKMVEAAALTGTDRVELYTESYAHEFAKGNKEVAVAPFVKAAEAAQKVA